MSPSGLGGGPARRTVKRAWPVPLIHHARDTRVLRGRRLAPCWRLRKAARRCGQSACSVSSDSSVQSQYLWEWDRGTGNSSAMIRGRRATSRPHGEVSVTPGGASLTCTLVHALGAPGGQKHAERPARAGTYERPCHRTEKRPSAWRRVISPTCRLVPAPAVRPRRPPFSTTTSSTTSSCCSSVLAGSLAEVRSASESLSLRSLPPPPRWSPADQSLSPPLSMSSLSAPSLVSSCTPLTAGAAHCGVVCPLGGALLHSLRCRGRGRHKRRPVAAIPAHTAARGGKQRGRACHWE